MVGKKIKEELESLFRTELGSVEVSLDGKQVTIRIIGEATFDSGQAGIRPELEPLLDKVGLLLRESRGDIVVSGHTDNVPVRGGPYENNLRLSMARAASVSEYFIRNRFVTPDRIVAIGFGEYRPLMSNETFAGREKNRRVEIVVTELPSLPEIRADVNETP
jgi:chemotaxis protein MotB